MRMLAISNSFLMTIYKELLSEIFECVFQRLISKEHLKELTHRNSHQITLHSLVEVSGEINTVLFTSEYLYFM